MSIFASIRCQYLLLRLPCLRVQLGDGRTQKNTSASLSIMGEQLRPLLLESLGTSQHYRCEGFKGGSQSVPRYAERRCKYLGQLVVRLIAVIFRFIFCLRENPALTQIPSEKPRV